MTTLSGEQEAIIRWTREGSGSAIVRARAGTGKTFTTLLAMQEMGGRVPYLVYNKKMAAEAEAKVAGMGLSRRVIVGTFHKFGFEAWRLANSRVKVEMNSKSRRLLVEAGDAIPDHFHKFAAAAVSLAKQSGFGLACRFNDPQAWLDLVEHYDLDAMICDGDLKSVSSDTEWVVQQACQAALRLLRLSIAEANKVIDADDMIYMPLLKSCAFPSYPWIAVDEAQDTNPVRRMLARKLLRPGGRALFVGDDRQAIYGFTGATADALDRIAKEFSARVFPLTLTYRCPRAVVAEAQAIVPDYRAHADAPEGTVRYITNDEFNQFTAENLGEGDAIICRMTAPLIDQAFSLIKRGVPCRVEGRAIGESLVKLMDRFGSVKSLPKLQEKVEAYRNKMIEKWMAKGEEQKADALADQADALIAVISSMPSGSTAVDVRKKIASMFEDLPDGSRPPHVVLLTAHRSKGLEFPRVYLLNRDKLMPSRFARQEWQMIQEDNLLYVAITRSEDELVYVDEVLPPVERERRAAA